MAEKARVDLAERLRAEAESKNWWPETRATALLREAASTIDQQEKALEAADELARVVEESPVGYGLPRSARAYRSARPTSTKEEQNNGD